MVSAPRIDTGADQCTGFMDMHVLEFGDTQLPTGGCQIDSLSAHHATRTGRHSQVFDHQQPGFVILIGFVMREDIEGQCLQRITREYRGGFTERLVATGFPAAQIIVVHRREIIMHQGIGMDEFDGAGRTVQLFPVAANGLAAGIDEGGAYAFATPSIA